MVFGLTGTGVRLGAERVFAFGGMRTHDITGKKANSLLWGCVPASILCTGTPQQVKDDVKAQVDLMGDTGA
jgi:hypothetical protein